ncbi:hypothetical protein ABW21_db0207909 [Orbilia brochopaga]|nr:hypothetical protein ABW21_db0207909 [Drechslerella brochopaga]
MIVLRKAHAGTTDGTIRATVVPGPTSSPNSGPLKGTFDETFRESEFGPKKFGELLARAGDHMGLDPHDRRTIRKTFSTHVLKIEITSSRHDDLTIIDVPGLIHHPREFQTEEDRVGIHKLVEHYINDRNTIIM